MTSCRPQPTVLYSTIRKNENLCGPVPVWKMSVRMQWHQMKIITSKVYRTKRENMTNTRNGTKDKV